MKHHHRIIAHTLALEIAIRIARVGTFFILGTGAIWLIKTLS